MASGIVDYIINQKAPIFFGSVIVILIPKRMLGANSSGKYPTNKYNADSGESNFGELWIESPAAKSPDGSPIVISKLQIDLENVVPLVIDGQHRTAAFRYVSRDMDFKGANRFHEMFTRHSMKTDQDNWNAICP